VSDEGTIISDDVREKLSLISLFVVITLALVQGQPAYRAVARASSFLSAAMVLEKSVIIHKRSSSNDR